MHILKNKFPEVLDAYKEHCQALAASGLGSLGKKASEDYPSRIKSLYNDLGDELINLLLKDKVETLRKKLIGDKSASSKISAFNHFSKFLKGFQDGVIRMNNTIKDVDLAQMIASVAIFAHESVVKDTIQGKFGSKNNKDKGNPYASLDHCQRQRKKGKRQIKGEKVETPSDSSYGVVYCDDNTTANRLFKDAIRVSLEKIGLEIGGNAEFRNYHVCHIWDTIDTPLGQIKSVYDNRFFTSAVNMVLVPSCIAGITDHNDYIKEVLKYRVVELYGELCNQGILKLPEAVSDIAKPQYYDRIKWS